MFKVANLVIDKYESMVVKENLEDWESDEISKLIGEKPRRLLSCFILLYLQVENKVMSIIKNGRRLTEVCTQYINEMLMDIRGHILTHNGLNLSKLKNT